MWYFNGSGNWVPGCLEKVLKDRANFRYKMADMDHISIRVDLDLNRLVFASKISQLLYL